MSQRYLGGIITANPTTPTVDSASGVWTLEQQFQNVANWPKSGVQPVSRSVRLRASVSAYFNRTPASAGNRKTWTWSGWVKRGALSGTFYIFGARQLATSTPYSLLYFASNDQLTYVDDAGSTVQTSQVFRDPSSWYHIVLSVDTTQATGSNRYRMYVNGVQITAFGTATYAAQNSSTAVNAAIEHDIGIASNGSGSRVSPFDGYMAEVNFIDGQALTPSYFGFTDANGVWQPATYSGTYGTNGFYLNFSDNSNNTAATIGKDYSGNGNNFTPSAGISVTAGATYDSMLDVPTNYADGGNGRGNYCTLNPVTPPGGTSTTITDGNLATSVASTTTFGKPIGTIGMSTGKWYWETTITAVGSVANVGISDGSPPSGSFGLGGVAGEIAYQSSGNKYTNNSSTAYGASYTTNDVIGVAYDADAGSITFYKNNASQGAVTGFSGTKFPAVGSGGGTNPQYALNFGQRPFAYTPPTGFVALNTQNLPASTINNGATVMAATTYTGTGATQVVSNAVNGVSMQPDWVWLKIRSGAANHVLIDAVRGYDKYLASNSTAAEATSTDQFTSFNSNGFTLGANSGAGGNTNQNGSTYVAWQWNAGGSTVTNTSGSISAQVRANPTAGFSVVTYTGTGANATVGHGLGVAPRMVIVKSRSLASQNWHTYHAAIDATSPANFIVILNGTVAKTTSAASWNNTAPTANVFSIGTDTSVNNSTSTYVAYCFAAVAGYSAFGSYTGNGSTDGPFVFTGFRPRYVLIKRTDAVGNWNDFDTSRNTYNGMNNLLLLNTADAEVAGGVVLDALSNGFKLRDGSANWNASAGTYVYAAFAENPFKTSRAR